MENLLLFIHICENNILIAQISAKDHACKSLR